MSVPFVTPTCELSPFAVSQVLIPASYAILKWGNFEERGKEREGRCELPSLRSLSSEGKNSPKLPRRGPSLATRESHKL